MKMKDLIEIVAEKNSADENSVRNTETKKRHSA